MVLVSPHYPWYFAWLIVFACFTRSLALLWLTTGCLLLYLVPVEARRSTYVETVRGCRSHCTFCFYPRSSSVLRVLDVERSAAVQAAYLGGAPEEAEEAEEDG